MEIGTKREIFKSKLNKFLEEMNNGRDSADISENKSMTKQKHKIVDGSVYDNRFQAQKEIIASQKVTIAEQKDMIEKLTLKNTSLENEVAFLKGLVENLKNCRINKSIDGTSVQDKIIVNPPKDPDILLRMKQREEERKKRWQYIKEQKANKERIQKVMLAEKEEEERLKVIEARRRKEQEEIYKKIAAEEELKQVLARRQFVVKKLKIWQYKYYIYLGFSKWILYIKMLYSNRATASYKIWRLFTVKCFKKWHFNSSVLRENKMLQARNNYLKTLQRKVVNKWKKFTDMKVQRRMKIGNRLNKIYMYKTILRWKTVTIKLRDIKTKKIETFSACYHRFLLCFYLNHWRELPRRMQEKREQEHRLRSWHSKVKEILPDFDADE